MRGLSHLATSATAAAVAGVLAVLAATGITLGLNANGGSGAYPAGSAGICERLAVPAYFPLPYWETAIHSKHPPADIILDVSGMGAGNAPNRQLQDLVRQAMAAGVTVLGYSSTADGSRPVPQVEADVRHYAAWYGVHSIFLDRVSGQPVQVPYYEKLAGFIHRAHQGAQVWLNPGVYPDQEYMSIGDVVMVFEGTYEQYVTAAVPAWVQGYPAARFADTIYATPGPVLVKALQMARRSRAEHVYVTDLVGSNPYQGLPNYWQAEDTDATAGCGGKR
jgi:Spherulation-specific family 4